MQFRRLLFIVLALSLPGLPSTVLVLPFHNNSQYPDLNWVGEGVAETLLTEFAQGNQIVLGRASRAEALRRLSLRPDATYTKASLIRLGQSLDADFVCYGFYDAQLPAGATELKNSSVQLSAAFLDLRKLHDGPALSESGKLAELSRLEEHLAFAALKYLDPATGRQLDQFLAPAKLIRVEAQESYVRGLISPSGDQQQKWFTQAAALDPHFSSPVFELGKLALQRKDNKQAIAWLQRIKPGDPHYPEARFKMGLAAYAAADYNAAVNYFREVLKTYPLNEIYNNLGAAEAQLNQPAALGDLHRAVDGDPNDPAYLFNLGAALLRNDRFEEAAKNLRALLDRNPDDEDARNLLDRAENHESVAANQPIAARLKANFDEAAFRQLRDIVQRN